MVRSARGLKVFGLFLFFMVNVLPFGVAHAGNRILLVISELDHRGLRELAPLYSKIEQLAWKIPSESKLLQKVYTHMVLVTQQEATIEGSQKALLEALADPSVEIVDVILGVHGLPQRIAFYDGSISVRVWVDQLQKRAQVEGQPESFVKLGWLYNLSCFGASHIDSFLKLGFKTVIGSRKVNANAEIEYPWVLEALALGGTVKGALRVPNSRPFLQMTDAPVRWVGKRQDNFLKDVDSFKEIGGKEDFRIK